MIMERNNKKITIAIDGFSSSGKSTMAKVLARNIGYAYIDSGAMYRAITLFCIENALIDDSGNVNETELERRIGNVSISFEVNPSSGASEVCLDGRNVEGKIRGMRVSNLVSKVAALPFVRRAMVAQQQQMGASKGIVMDGRDIGTTVFPDAEMKVFVDASAETRAHRRYEELKQKGQIASYDEVYRNVCERDYLDMTRDESPLRKADDAYVIDNSDMTIAQQNAWLMCLYNKIITQ